MSRRLPNATIHEIGADRIDKLLTMSEEAVRNGREDRARRYVEIAMAISGKTRVKMPKERKFCKNCHLPLMPGVTCTVRLSSHKVCMRCNVCGEVRRLPYIREQRT
ncbi:MAG: ribonuclease P protein component 4 [Candidatus Methanomethylophilaceae archaeon]|jgi:ribonuclease P protein subunit RPR2|nr:ribonuclease P protein component 4 [Candidatus Methanomethylophilaceae archaeon]